MRNLTPYLNNKLQSNRQTPFNKADPKMSVKVSRARTTVMDSDYWIVETIREKPDLGDVSVAPRRLKAYGAPDRIYEIHVDNGIVRTAIREYPDKLKERWKDQFILGEGSSVAIAFNGDWESYRKNWNLLTGEKPWVFWVDNSNVLWRQHWDNETTKAELATGVVYVRAIRAWKNRVFPLQDQGIVVGYIKTDGTVCYRNYCYQADGSYAWEYEKNVSDFTGSALSLNLFITNDYRMGFVIEDTVGQVHWLITARNWGGMAVEQHVINIRAYAEVKLVAVKYRKAYAAEKLSIVSASEVAMLFGRVDNSIVSVVNVPITRLNEHGEEYEDWGFVVRFELNFETKTMPLVSLYDKITNSSIPVSSVVAVQEGYAYEVYVDASQLEFGFNIAQGDIGITLNGMYNEAGYLYNEIQEQFTPIGLVMPVFPLPEVEVIWNE
ncbi:MAG: hypothetical protein BWY74_03318 [Firmicutes bacterium ADurb.Bin419]|nr:MAG: hypothetical protein BWY74_03318 [Firmicutes bacterium ADurb.Bin419]